MSYCSPKQILSNKKIKNSCIDDGLIDQMVHLYNSKNTTDLIDKSLSDEKKLELLINRLQPELPCNKDYCLGYSNTLKELQSKIKEEFRPAIPKKWKENKEAWLNTLDLLESLNQYNSAFKDFKFITVTPIDFDTRLNSWGSTDDNGVCVDKRLCQLELSEYLKDGITRLGAVFNLDRHDQRGSHWTSMFTSLSLGEFYYFDSVAKTLPREISMLAMRIVSQGNSLVVNNKLSITSKKYPFYVENNQISITDICNFLLKDDNFVLYRFAFLFPITMKYNIKMKNHKELTGKIISRILEIIDITNQEHYAVIPGLDELIKRIDNKKLHIDDFVNEWVSTNLNIAINNLLFSIRVLGNGSNRANVIDTSLVDDSFHFKLDKEIVDKRLEDMSFKAFKNFIQHQFLNSECGMYSINFIDSFLVQNKTFEEIISQPIDDKTMNSLRFSKYFSPV